MKVRRHLSFIIIFGTLSFPSSTDRELSQITVELKPPRLKIASFSCVWNDRIKTQGDANMFPDLEPDLQNILRFIVRSIYHSDLQRA